MESQSPAPCLSDEPDDAADHTLSTHADDALASLLEIELPCPISTLTKARWQSLHALEALMVRAAPPAWTGCA